MKRGKYLKTRVPAKASRRRKLNKYFLVTLSVMLLLGIVGGATFAYIIAEGEPVNNSFTPGRVVCEVQSDFSVTNKGNTDAFMRAAVVANWENADGDICGIAPEYTITLGSGWTEGSDGYYYYGSEVAPNEKTTAVVADVQKKGSVDGFDLSVVVLAEAIQADGMDVNTAQAAWAKAAGNG